MVSSRFMLITAIALSAVNQPASAQVILNGDFSAGNTGFTSDYNFVPFPGSGGPGSYAINTNPQLFQAGLVSMGDHTTGTGNMMIVDGSSSSSQAVWRQVVSVLPNTQYTFDAWAANTFPNNPSVIRFEANGVPLGLDLGLLNTAGTWQPFNATWNSGANTSVTLAIYDMNTNIGVVGNDFALDDITMTAVPEPSSMLLLAGVGAFGAFRAHRRCRRPAATA